jgi:hypothetical protein
VQAVTPPAPHAKAAGKAIAGFFREVADYATGFMSMSTAGRPTWMLGGKKLEEDEYNCG